MKILNIMLGKGRGGLEQVALDYAVGLRGGGAEVVFVTAPDAAINEAAHAQEVMLATLANYGAWDRRAALKLTKIAFHFGTDIIITHGNRALCLASLAHTQLPIVAVAHNYQLKHMGKADAVFCITQQAMAAVSKVHPALAERCYFTPNMIADVGVTPRTAFTSPPRIGAMGRMVAKKGFDVWLRALAKLKEQGVAFNGVLAGEGEEKQALLELRNRLGLEQEVAFTGWAEDVGAFYASIDLLCVPSHHEPFGLVIIEGMAHGLPVISTKSEGAVEILANPAHGVLVEKNDPVAMAEAMAALLRDSSSALHMGAQGQAYVQAMYGMHHRSEAMMQSLQEVIEKKRLNHLQK